MGTGSRIGADRVGARAGLTLVEVLVALVILELGVLGATSLLVLAGRTMARAERLEVAVAAAEGVADSLSKAAVLEDGARILLDGATLSWRVEVDRSFRVERAPGRGGGPRVVLRGRSVGR